MTWFEYVNKIVFSFVMRGERKRNSKDYRNDKEMKRLVRKCEAFRIRGDDFNCLNICREKMQYKKELERGKKELLNSGSIALA